MEKLEYYISLPYAMQVTEDPEEGGFVISFPELPGCISCGYTLESAKANAQDAKRCWLEAMMEEGKPIPLPGYAGIPSEENPVMTKKE